MNLLKLLCKEKDGNIVIDFDDVVVRGVTVVREGEITAGAADSGLRSAAGRGEKVEAPKEAVKPASPWRKYALMALAIILFGWLANVAPKSSSAISPSSRWPAWWVTTWCGTSPMRCIRR